MRGCVNAKMTNDDNSFILSILSLSPPVDDSFVFSVSGGWLAGCSFERKQFFDSSFLFLVINKTLFTYLFKWCCNQTRIGSRAFFPINSHFN